MYTVPADTPINSESIKNAIKANESDRKRYDLLWRYYIGIHSKILDREKTPGLKNNKVVVNHAKYITDVNIGYLLGNPVEYQGSDGVNIDKIVEAYKKQTITDTDSEIAKKVSAMGKSYDYTYVGEGNNELYTKSVDPRKAIIAYDDTFEHIPVFAVMYSGCELEGDGKFYDVMVLTDKNIQTFDQALVLQDTSEHFFGEIPLVEYKNNPEEMGDFEPVLELIDAYNLIQSDRVNDQEQLVDAILALYGFNITPEQKKELKKSGVLGDIPLDAKAEYISKTLNEADADTLRKTIEADIHKISMTPNLSDQEFVGNSSGVAIRYKLLAFEQNIKNKERYFERGLIKRFGMYSVYLNHLNSSNPVIELYKVDAVFKRNLPQNDVETATMINNLTGLVSQETLISQLSFIDDASKEVEDANAEAAENANLESPQFGTDSASIPTKKNIKDLSKKASDTTSKTQNTIVDKIKKIIDEK